MKYKGDPHFLAAKIGRFIEKILFGNWAGTAVSFHTAFSMIRKVVPMFSSDDFTKILPLW
jgi:hypothetical protein